MVLPDSPTGLDWSVRGQVANLARVEVIMREFDEMCMAAAELRRRIQRDMRATHAREEIGFLDDQAVTRAREREKA